MKSYKLLVIFIFIGLWVFILSQTTDFLQGESLTVIFSFMGLGKAFMYGILPRLKEEEKKRHIDK